MIDFGREVCGFLPASERREWLVTNGIGGYASGTVAGVRTRKYHGVLVAALNPPLGRTMLVGALQETVVYDDREYALYAVRLNENEVSPPGYVHIERFYLDGSIPTWHYACADALIEKRIWMQHGANTTYVTYRLLRGTQPLKLTIRGMVNYRDHHAATKPNQLTLETAYRENGIAITPSDGESFFLLSEGAEAHPENEWYLPHYLGIEAERGHIKDIEDSCLYAARFVVTLLPREVVSILATTEAEPDMDINTAYAYRKLYEADLYKQADTADSQLRQLVLGADQFIVRRGDGHTVLAGYPWFGDWGRDTMIALPGLTIATGRYEIAASILRTFAQFVDQGMLPNRFPDYDEQPEYNTVDATLWYFQAIYAYWKVTKDKTLIRELMPVLKDIIKWHIKGTRYEIHRTEDGLLYAGNSSVQLTWMDVKIDDWVVTPRTGKAVEINSLWYNALQIMAELDGDQQYAAHADQVQAGFSRFWNSELGCCYDVIDSPNGDDASLRPNQLCAVSLPFSPLSAGQQKGVVDICARHLLTSHGLRSLAPDHPDYAGRYAGDPKERDAVYHQGTVWAWLIGPFATAHYRVYGDRSAARGFVMPLIRHLQEHSLGTISEIFDGDPPHAPHGCWAQAWSVAEVIRVLNL